MPRSQKETDLIFDTLAQSLAKTNKDTNSIINIIKRDIETRTSSLTQIKDLNYRLARYGAMIAGEIGSAGARFGAGVEWGLIFPPGAVKDQPWIPPKSGKPPLGQEQEAWSMENVWQMDLSKVFGKVPEWIPNPEDGTVWDEGIDTQLGGFPIPEEGWLDETIKKRDEKPDIKTGTEPFPDKTVIEKEVTEEKFEPQYVFSSQLEQSIAAIQKMDIDQLGTKAADLDSMYKDLMVSRSSTENHRAYAAITQRLEETLIQLAAVQERLKSLNAITPTEDGVIINESPQINYEQIKDIFTLTQVALDIAALLGVSVGGAEPTSTVAGAARLTLRFPAYKRLFERFTTGNLLSNASNTNSNSLGVPIALNNSTGDLNNTINDIQQTTSERIFIQPVHTIT